MIFIIYFYLMKTTEITKIEGIISNFERKMPESANSNDMYEDYLATTSEQLQYETNKTNQKNNIYSNYYDTSPNPRYTEKNHLYPINIHQTISEEDQAASFNFHTENIDLLYPSISAEFSSQIDFDSLLESIFMDNNDIGIPEFSDHQILSITTENEHSNIQENFSCQNHPYSDEIDMNNIIFPQIRNISTQEHQLMNEQSILCFSGHENLNNDEQNEQFISNTGQIYVNETDEQRNFINISYKEIANIELSVENNILVWKYNLSFILGISYFFMFNHIKFAKKDQFKIVSNSQQFIEKHINLTNLILQKQNTYGNNFINDFSYQIQSTEFNHFCPLCPFNKFDAEIISKTEDKFILDLFESKVALELIILIQKLFTQISKSFNEPFSPERLFSTEFFKPQRIVLEDLLDFLSTKKRILLSLKQRVKYIHSEYHKLFLTNIEMKLYFLSDLPSIIYVLLETRTIYHLLSENQNFIILFYSFYSLNMFFGWITEFYGECKVLVNSSESSYFEFVVQIISFVMRIAFIEPIFSVLKVPQTAQIEYHLLSMNIFNNELYTFLGKENFKKTIAINSKILISFIVLIGEYRKKDEFLYFLEFDRDQYFKINAFELHYFINFLDFLINCNIPYLSEQSLKLKNHLPFTLQFVEQ